MASRIGGNSDGGDSVCGVEIDGFDEWEGGIVIGFGVELCLRVGC